MRWRVLCELGYEDCIHVKKLDKTESLVAELATKYEDMEVNEADADADDNTSVHSSSTKASGGSNTSGGSSTWADALEEESIFNVAESWEDLRRIPGYEQTAGTILFKQ